MELMEIFTEIKNCIFYKYADFDTRSDRKEFWFFFLFSIICSLATTFLYKMVAYWLGEEKELVIQLSFIIILFIISIPCIATTVRRFHDSGKSGWETVIYCILLGLTYLILPKDDLPIILVLAAVINIRLLYVLTIKGEISENKYGIPPE